MIIMDSDKWIRYPLFHSNRVGCIRKYVRGLKIIQEMENRKKVALYTLGCKVNAAETDVLTASFKQRGYQTVGFNEKSDIYVINTCTVTQQADSECRKIIRRARKTSPEAVIAVVGCYAQSDPLTISNIDGVDIILGTHERFTIFELLENNSCFTEPVIRTELGRNPFEAERLLSYDTSRTRAFLKVQDGCSYTCSYCIIPAVRGLSICRKRNSVLNRIKEMRDAGFNEIVLTAVNLGEYENDRDYRLLHLLQDICAIPGIPRIRLSSIEPNCLHEELIKYVADSALICSHFHVPLQSGSDSILKKMRRRYNSKCYAEAIETIKKYLPDAAVGADVMVGFPGETEDFYEESFRFVKEMPVSYLHVFRYSPRVGTVAAEFRDFVPQRITRERSKRFIELGRRKKGQFLMQQIGKTAEVLFESKHVDGKYYGFTRNYVRVSCNSNGIAHRREFVKIMKKNGMTVEGQIVPCMC